jgi:ribosomal protein S18 acetylase RimI-like enzyme
MLRGLGMKTGSPNFESREFLLSDYEAAVSLWEQAEGVELSEGDSREEIRSYLARNPGLSRVAVEGERTIGVALCGHDGRRGFIYHLAVDPAARGRGVGKSLVEECAAGLKAVGIVRAIILVAADNATGREFWLKNGWETTSGAIPMARDLL